MEINEQKKVMIIKLSNLTATEINYLTEFFELWYSNNIDSVKIDFISNK